MSKQNICLLFGGMSPEHDVSLWTATSILANIDKEKYNVFPVGITREGKWRYYDGDISAIANHGWEKYENLHPAAIQPSKGDGLFIFEREHIRTEPIDCVFPALHGKDGEDGSIQGLCQLGGIPCVGANLSASAVSMDKSFTKAIVSHLEIRQADFVLLPEYQIRESLQDIYSLISGKFTYPVFVKPACTGSSVGITKVKKADDLESALYAALEFDTRVLVEEFFDGREIEVAVLGNRDPLVSVCGEIVPGAEFYTYDDKYLDGRAIAHIPADLPEETSAKVRDYAKRIYIANGCTGLSRVDFFVHKTTGEICFNEINTLPGFTDISMYPKLFIHGGISYPELITKLIDYATE